MRVRKLNFPSALAAAVLCISLMQGGIAQAQSSIVPPEGFESETAAVVGSAGVGLACGGVSGGTDLDGLCGATGSFGDDDFSQISPAHQQAVAEAQRQAQSELTGDLTGPTGRTALVRNAALKGKPSGFAFNGARMSRNDPQTADVSFSGTGGGAAADSAAGLSKLGAFVNVKYGAGKQKQNAFEAGFDFDVIGVLGGVDFRFTDHLVVGAAIGYKRTTSDYVGFAAGSEFDVDNYSFAVYGSYYPNDAIYLDVFAGYGRNDISTERGFSPVGQAAKGDTNSNQYGISSTLGYQFTRKALTLGPYVQANWQRADVDGYTETGSGFALMVDTQNLKSFSTVLGGRLDYAISTGFGVIVPTFRLEWEHEFSNDSRAIIAEFASDPGSTMSLRTPEPDRNFFNVGAGVSATFSGGITAFVDFEVLAGHVDLENYTTTVGARFEF